MTQAPLEYRPYRVGDRDKILELFELSFGFPMSAAYWDWRFADNPHGPVAAQLVWSGETLAGYFSASPATVVVRGEALRGAAAVTSMTHPDFRRRGIYGSLGRQLTDRLEQDGYALLWTFPAHRAHRMVRRDLQWDNTSPVAMFRLRTESMRGKPSESPNVAPMTEVDAEVDALWTRVADRFPIQVKRDRRYTQWRYLDHPDRYDLLAYHSGGELLGYAVTKPYRDTNLNIVDLVAVDDEEVELALVNAALAQALSEGRTVVDLWLPIWHPRFDRLESIGFWLDAPHWILLSRRLAGLPADLDAADPRNWHYTQTDCDVF